MWRLLSVVPALLLGAAYPCQAMGSGPHPHLLIALPPQQDASADAIPIEAAIFLVLAPLLLVGLMYLLRTRKA